METTVDLLERLRTKNDGCSDYRLAKLLTVSTSSVVNYTKHGRTMSDEVAIKLAELLDEHPGYVLACMAAERSQNPETVRIWEQISSQFAASILFAIPLILLGFQATSAGV